MQGTVQTGSKNWLFLPIDYRTYFFRMVVHLKGRDFSVLGAPGLHRQCDARFRLHNVSPIIDWRQISELNQQYKTLRTLEDK